MENRDTQSLVERLIDLLQKNEKESDDSLRISLDKINQRLNNIESRVDFQIPDSRFQTLKSNHSSHSSQEKFTNLEELADEIINGLPNEKACPFEPAGKPCDHCAMCNSRGF